MPSYGAHKPTSQETQYFSDLVLSKLPAIFARIDARQTSKFDAEDLQRYLRTHLNHTAPISTTEEAVWEIDDDHDGKVSWDEFRTAMTRCIHDPYAREPQQVFYVVLFSVFSGGSGMLSEQGLRKLLHLRFGKATVDDKLANCFGRKDTACSVGFEEFVRGMSSSIL